MFAYLEVLDLMKVVRQKENWDHFKDVFNIPKPNKKGKTYYLDWMEEFNELRRILHTLPQYVWTTNSTNSSKGSKRS